MRLQVFKSTSGEKMLEIQAHDDEVLCCAFSPDDRLLATCSSDRKVKVWCGTLPSAIQTLDRLQTDLPDNPTSTDGSRLSVSNLCCVPGLERGAWDSDEDV